MGQDFPNFADLLADAYHAARALDGVQSADVTAAALRDGRRMYSQLLEYRKTTKMTLAQGALVQRALDLIWGSLRAAKTAQASREPAMPHPNSRMNS